MRIVNVAGALTLPGCSLLAQSDRAVLSGVVLDSSGAAIPGAIVTAIQYNFCHGQQPADDFTVPALPVGDYQVRIEKEGFKTYVARGITMTAGGTTRVSQRRITWGPSVKASSQCPGHASPNR